MDWKIIRVDEILLMAVRRNIHNPRMVPRMLMGMTLAVVVVIQARTRVVPQLAIKVKIQQISKTCQALWTHHFQQVSSPIWTRHWEWEPLELLVRPVGKLDYPRCSQWDRKDLLLNSKKPDSKVCLTSTARKTVRNQRDSGSGIEVMIAVGWTLRLSILEGFLEAQRKPRSVVAVNVHLILQFSMKLLSLRFKSNSLSSKIRWVQISR